MNNNRFQPFWRNPFKWLHKFLFFGYFTPYMKKAQIEGLSSVRAENLPGENKN